MTQSWDPVSTSECRSPGKLLALHDYNNVDKLKQILARTATSSANMLYSHVHQNKARGVRRESNAEEGASSWWDGLWQTRTH